MIEKRSNHTVYNVNYYSVWCPKYRHPILEPIEESLEVSFRDVCEEYGYEILSSSENLDFRDHERRSLSNDSTSLLTTYTCSFPPTRSTPRARLCEQSRASRRGRCGNSTNRSWRSICGVADFGRNRTTLGPQAMFRPTRLSSILSVRNTFNGAYRLHPRGQAPRHSACSACRYRPYRPSGREAERIEGPNR